MCKCACEGGVFTNKITFPFLSSRLSNTYSRRIDGGGVRILIVSKFKISFSYFLKCVSIILKLNTYVSDSTLSEDFRLKTGWQLLL